MMHPIHRYLKSAGRKLWRGRAWCLTAQAFSLVFSYLALYALALLLVRPLSLTWLGLLFLPSLLLVAWLIGLFFWVRRLRNPREVARILEHQHPSLGLSLRTSLDFMEGKSDVITPGFQQPFLAQTTARLQDVYPIVRMAGHWSKAFFVSLVVVLAVWLGFSDRLLKKFYKPSYQFSNTRLVLSEGNISIFEPEYTQIPGRTLPLKPGSYKAFPGARIRFTIHLPENNDKLFLSTGQEDQVIPLVANEGVVAHEFVLMEEVTLRFLLSQSGQNGQTQAYHFETKSDQPPEVALRNYTPEGPVLPLNPLYVEANVKDDFGVAGLEAVIEWDGGEKRLPLSVQHSRRTHFISKNSWNLSDFEMPDVDAFTLYLEAKDNNPFNGPGIGRSARLHYELESPQKQFDEFMALARELLDQLTMSLGDNLETMLDEDARQAMLRNAFEMGQSIQEGVIKAKRLSNELLALSGQSQNLVSLDREFIFDLRQRLTQSLNQRRNLSNLYVSILNQPRPLPQSVNQISRLHALEEVSLEDITFDLLKQLKMWALFDLERRGEQLEDLMDEMENMLNNSEQMEASELQKQMEQMLKMMQQMMSEMMKAAANEMEMNMQEFVNMDGMKQPTDALQQLMEEFKQALQEGDTEKAKQIMAQMREMMQQMRSGMKESLGKMSPEMQAMMQDMAELRGLLGELKELEEGLEGDTRDLKRKLDELMGGNRAELSPQQKQMQQSLLENIHRQLNELNENLVDLRKDESTKEIIEEIGKKRLALDGEDPQSIQSQNLKRDIAYLENLLGLMSNMGLDRMQNLTLRALEQTEKMQDYLDQNELMLSLEAGYQLESLLSRGERLGSVNQFALDESGKTPQAVYQETGAELRQILDALQNLRNALEQRRQSFMGNQGEQGHQQLGQRQKQIQDMIKEFMERTGESFGDGPVEQKLQEIAQAMQQAQGRLQGGLLDGGINYEQDALQKIGEMLEQMQQQSRPGGMRFGFGQRKPGWDGSPVGEVAIPDSEHKVSPDRIKEIVRRQLEQSLPENYGKEIRKYYEKLIDQ